MVLFRRHIGRIPDAKAICIVVSDRRRDCICGRGVLRQGACPTQIELPDGSVCRFFAVCLLSPLAGALYTGQRGCLLALAAATVGNAALWGGIFALLVQYRRQAAAGLILKILAGICAVLVAFCFIPIRFCVTSLSATESHPCYIVQGDRIIGDKNGLYTDAAKRVAAFSDAARGERLDWNLNRTLSWDVLNHPDTQFLVYGEAEITEQVDQSGERVLVYRFDTLEWDLYGIVASEDPLRAFFRGRI